MKSIIRVLYSNPASHGGATIALVLKDPELKAQWIAELDEMRARIKEMRQQFVDLLKECGAEQDFSFIVNQNGMFSFSGLTPEQVDRLKDEFAIYAVRSGRINVRYHCRQYSLSVRKHCESIVSTCGRTDHSYIIIFFALKTHLLR